MSEITDTSMTITKDDGTEEVLQILFYYENPERNKTFYFVFKEENPEDVFVLTSSDGESLEYPTDEEQEEAEEMFETYENDPKIAEARK